MADWFLRDAQPNFEEFVLPHASEPLSFLQLGAYQGDAGVWIMQNFPHATLIDVDNFAVGDGMPGESADIERDYHAQMGVWIEAGRAQLFKQDTFQFLREHRWPMFDCIYVDAYHSGSATLTNAVMSWDFLKPGGVMGFDDYDWCHPTIGAPPGHRPGPSIDAFCAIFGADGLLDLLPDVERHPGAGTIQRWVRKR